MSNANRNNVLIIMASNKGFPFDGYLSEGYNTISAYTPIKYLLTRILREICFRMPLLPKSIWYNHSIKQYNAKYIYIRDAIITRDYLLWLQKIFPNAQINFSYENMIGRARHLKPNQIPKGIRIWTYDSHDSTLYGIRLKTIISYFKCYVKKSKNKKYDLLFVGRDKGRGDWLIKLEEFLNAHGIKTKFLIVSDGKFSKRKSYYGKPVSYDQITHWLAESRAVLNVGMKNQKGVTMRDIESYFNEIKLVTTNKNIVNTEIYDAYNTFFLTGDNWEELVDFLKREYTPCKKIVWKNHQIDDAIEEITKS